MKRKTKIGLTVFFTILAIGAIFAGTVLIWGACTSKTFVEVLQSWVSAPVVV